MALVTQVSNLRTYNLKFSDFGIDQAVEQPIPVEPNRTVPKEIDRRQDDVTRLNAFLFSGKGATFAGKQAILGQDLSLELNPRKRLTDAANTAARLVNIALQASPAGQIARFSSNPFGRYIEARGFVGQIGNLLRADAPSLAKRGRTIIPDYEVEDERSRVVNEQTENKIRQFINSRPRLSKFLGRVDKVRDFYNNVKDLNSLANNVDGDPTSLKSTLDTDGSKFDKPFREGYVVDAVDSRENFGKTLISDLSVENKVDDPIDRPRSENRLNIFKTDLNPGYNDLIRNPNYTKADSIRFTARRAGRNENGNFRNRAPYITSFNNLEQAFDENVSNIKIDIITPEITERLLFTAYIDSFSDTFSGNWNGTNYIGRAEPVYNYTGFNRDYSFNFKVASLSVNELKELYRKLNTLAGTTAPTYSGTFMRGTFVRLKIGDYLDSTPGFISSIGFSWNTTYPWQAQKTEKFKGDLNTEGGVYDNVPLLPHILDVSCNFTPIHNFIPQTNTNINLTDFAYIASTDLNNTLTAVSPETEQSSLEVQPNNSVGVPASNNEELEAILNSFNSVR